LQSPVFEEKEFRRNQQAKEGFIDFASLHHHSSPLVIPQKVMCY